jgi:hypothetical protein
MGHAHKPSSGTGGAVADDDRQHRESAGRGKAARIEVR